MENALNPPAVARAERRAAPLDFDHLVCEHQRKVYRVLLGLVRDPDLADNLTQECFLRAYEKRSSFRGEANPGTWLVSIALNLARDHGRSRRIGFWKRLFSGPAEETSAALERSADLRSSPEQAVIARQELDRVWAVVGTLSSHQREAFLLRFAEEMSLEEIAAAMGIEVGTVKSHLFRAVGAVRQRMREHGRGQTSE